MMCKCGEPAVYMVHDVGVKWLGKITGAEEMCDKYGCTPLCERHGLLKKVLIRKRSELQKLEAAQS